MYALAVRGGASLHFKRFSSWVICQCLFLCVGVIKPIRVYSVSHWASLGKSMPCLHNLYHVRLQLVLELTKNLKRSLEVLWITHGLSCYSSIIDLGLPALGQCWALVIVWGKMVEFWDTIGVYIKRTCHIFSMLCVNQSFQRLKSYYLLCFQYSVSTPAFAFASFVFRRTLRTMAPKLGWLLVKWTSVNVISTKNAWVHITFS